MSPVPAAGWPFPTLSLRSLRGCSDPYPAALLGCMRPLLRREHRSHPRVDGFDARVSPHMAASVGTSISRLQSFDHLRAPTLARPPGCSHRSSTIAAGRPDRSHHASPGRLPEPGCGVATCSTRTISTAGLSPAGSQPCRLLPTPSMWSSLLSFPMPVHPGAPPVPAATFRTFHAPYAGRFLGAASRLFTPSMAFARTSTGSAPPPPPAGGC